MKRKGISTRERWLLALLPAALLIIGSFILPGGKAERRQLNALLSNAPGDEEMHRELAELAETIDASRAEAQRIDDELAQLRRPKTPGRQASHAEPGPTSLAERFKQLGGRLDQAGIAIVSTEMVRQSGSSVDGASTNSWRLTVASTWAELTNAIAQPDLVPAGLAIDSITMDPPRTGTRLRRWVIMLSTSSGAQRS